MYFLTNHAVVDIGKIMNDKDDVHGEFIGMMKFTPRGAEIFRKHFHRAKQLFGTNHFSVVRFFKRHI